MTENEIELFCERCNKDSGSLRPVAMTNSKTQERWLMYVCEECYAEHPWPPAKEDVCC